MRASWIIRAKVERISRCCFVVSIEDGQSMAIIAKTQGKNGG